MAVLIWAGEGVVRLASCLLASFAQMVGRCKEDGELLE